MNIQNSSVHLIITSPPYWQIKDYGNNNQVGFHNSYEDYINNLKDKLPYVFKDTVGLRRKR